MLYGEKVCGEERRRGRERGGGGGGGRRVERIRMKPFEERAGVSLWLNVWAQDSWRQLTRIALGGVAREKRVVSKEREGMKAGERGECDLNRKGWLFFELLQHQKPKFQ